MPVAVALHVSISGIFTGDYLIELVQHVMDHGRVGIFLYGNTVTFMRVPLANSPLYELLYKKSLMISRMIKKPIR